MIKRYDQYGDYPFEKATDLVTKILKTVITDGKNIELDTSNFRYSLKYFMSSRDILRLYKELGGKIIVIGSDSHKENILVIGLQKSKTN